MFRLNLKSNIRVFEQSLKFHVDTRQKCALYRFSQKCFAETAKRLVRHVSSCFALFLSLLIAQPWKPVTLMSQVWRLLTKQNPNRLVTAQMTCDFTRARALRGTAAGASGACRNRAGKLPSCVFALKHDQLDTFSKDEEFPHISRVTT